MASTLAVKPVSADADVAPEATSVAKLASVATCQVRPTVSSVEILAWVHRMTRSDKGSPLNDSALDVLAQLETEG
ncbi:MAG: hypothetical protein JWP34_3025, partial [Massilia sp.]|nr:hypothetical protein [Massilia sp.]